MKIKTEAASFSFPYIGEAAARIEIVTTQPMEKRRKKKRRREVMLQSFSRRIDIGDTTVGSFSLFLELQTLRF